MNDNILLLQFLLMIYFLMFILNIILTFGMFCFDRTFRNTIRKTHKKDMLVYLLMLSYLRELYAEGVEETEKS